MQRVRQDDAPARARFLEVLFARMHHEAATPLLTASGFARIAAETAADADPAATADTLHRVTSGVERARGVLSTAAGLVASEDVHRVDLLALVEELAAAAADRGTPVVLSLPTDRVWCYAEAAVVRDLVGSLLELVAARSPDGAVAVDVGTAGVGTVVLVLEGGGPWPPTAVAAATVAPGAQQPDVVPDQAGAAAAGEAGVVTRLALAAATQLATLWLDPQADGRSTLRLLAAHDDAATPPGGAARPVVDG